MERKDNSLFSQERDLPGIQISPGFDPLQFCPICGNVRIIFLLFFLEEINLFGYGKRLLGVRLFLNHTLGHFVRNREPSFFQGGNLFLQFQKARSFSLFDFNVQQPKSAQFFQCIFSLAVKDNQRNFFHRHNHVTATSLPAAASFFCAIFFLEILERTTALTCWSAI